MKFLIESKESSLLIHKEDEAIVLDLNGQKIAIQGADLEDFKNLVGNLFFAIDRKKEDELPLIKQIQRVWKGTL